jgi:glycosyltransferase involved in cell wall biosynthesis
MSASDGVPGLMKAAPMLIDVTRLVDRQMQGRLPTGVDRVCLEYVRRFGDRSLALIRCGGRWVVLPRQNSARLFGELGEPAAGFSRRVIGLVARSLPSTFRGLPRGAVLLNLGHSALDQTGYAATIRRYDLRPLFFLHDLIPVTHPEYARPGEPERHARRVETMLGYGRGILVNSRDTLDALQRFASDRHISLPPCRAASLAPGRLPAPAPKPPIDQPYFVMLGTIEPRKNHLLLLHLWRELVRSLGDGAPVLILIGQRGWECEQVVDLLERCAVLQGKVVEIPCADDNALATWLHHARALLFPSFVEGYGLPLVEALSLGTPVIASDLPVFREIAGEIPDYLDPMDGLGWKKHILDYAQPFSAKRAVQLERLKGYRPPTWEDHFRIVETFLAEIGLEASQ